LKHFIKKSKTKTFKDLDVEFETKISEELERTIRQKLVQIAIADAKKSYAETLK
jgi:hypothetical protein